MGDSERRLDRRVTWAALALILCLAATLRFVGLSWGLRHPPHSDERDFVSRVVAMVAAGDLDHRWYQYPGLFLYLLGAGVFPLGEARWNGSDAYLACRAVVSAFGVLNVGLIYLVGSRLLGAAGGLAAALWLAVSPLDIQTSHQVRADIVLQTAGLLALLALRRVGEDPKGDRLMGLVIGFAMAVKFTGLVLVPSYLAARLLAPGRRFRGMVVAGAITVGVILACTPYALLHWREYFGIGATGSAAYNSIRGGPATYYKGSSDSMRTLAFMLEGATGTLGVVAVGLALLGAVMSLRQSWRTWVPPLLHPIATLMVVAPAGMMFQRHILPAMGVVYLFAATPVEWLSRRSRLAAAALAIAAAVSPVQIAASNVYVAAQPSALDKTLDWINENLPSGSRILETRPESRVGATAGMALGIDPERYEILELRSDEDRIALRLLAPEMDLVVVGPSAGGPWRSSLKTVFQGSGPLGNVLLQLQTPWEGARPLHARLDVSRARVSASENEGDLSALFDNDIATSWSTRAPMAGNEWIQVAFAGPVSLGRIELVLGNEAAGYGPEIHLLTSQDGQEYEPVRGVEARALPSRQIIRPPSQILVLAARPIRSVKIMQMGARREPWVVSDLRLEATSPSGRVRSW